MWYNRGNLSETAQGAGTPRAASSNQEGSSFMATMSDSTCLSDNSQHYVYAIQAESSPIKIGIAGDLRDRLFHLQTAHFEQLTLLFSVRCPSREIALQLENALHRKYADCSIRGEWFDIAAEKLVVDTSFIFEIAGLIAGCELEFASQYDQLTTRRDKAMPSRDQQRRVIDFLTEYPDAAQMPSRQLAARIEEVTGVRIGHDTANKGRNAWTELRSASNGHITEATS